MRRLDYTALYNGLTATLKRKPVTGEVIDALLKAGFAGSGYRRVLQDGRVFLEQDDAPQAQQGTGDGERETSSGDRNDGAVDLPAAGSEDQRA